MNRYVMTSPDDRRYTMILKNGELHYYMDGFVLLYSPEPGVYILNNQTTVNNVQTLVALLEEVTE